MDQCSNRHADGRREDGEDGFTLVELLVVLAIIALIATIAGPQILRYLGSAKTGTAKAQIKNIESALELYYIDNTRYPTKEEGLASLVAAPQGSARWNGPYFKGGGGLNDPWGNPYLYEAAPDGSSVVIRSLGRDGAPDGAGEDQDISN